MDPHLCLFALFVFGIVVVPGMDMAFVLSSALVDGRRAGLAAAVLARRPVVGETLFRVLLGAGCVAAAIPAAAVLAGATVPEVRLAPVTPLGPWVFGLDALSAVFLLAILSVGAACAFYGLTYLAHERAHRAIGAAHLLFALLVATLAPACEIALSGDRSGST